MKRFILIAIIFLSLNSYTQTFNGGFFAGPVASQVYGDGLKGYDKSGFHFGGFVNNFFGGDLGVQFELQYITKGSRRNININKGITNYYLLKLNYVEAPLSLQLRSGNFIYELGASYGVLVNAKEDADGYGYVEPDDPPYKSFEIAGLAGFHYYITDYFTIEFRVSYSLLPIRPYPGNQSFYFDAGQRNNLLSLSFYYQFHDS